jgi:hypothetical protein
MPLEVTPSRFSNSVTRLPDTYAPPGVYIRVPGGSGRTPQTELEGQPCGLSRYSSDALSRKTDSLRSMYLTRAPTARRPTLLAGESRCILTPMGRTP